MRDEKIIEKQIGRKLSFPTVVAVRCRHGYPVVVASAPLWKGKPFPTVLWLTCPLLKKLVGGLESEGFQRRLDYWGGDRRFLFLRLYYAGILGVKEKISFYPQWGYIAGENRGHVKCLHAHLAVFLATGEGPGGKVWEQVENDFYNCENYCELFGISKVIEEEEG